MNRSFARLCNVLMAFALVLLGTIVMATPASAHHPVITSNAVCNTSTGKYDVTWTIKSDADYNKDWLLTSVSRSIGISTPTAAKDDQLAFTGTESVSGTNAVQTLTLTVSARWQNKTNANADVATSTMSGTATIPATACTQTVPLPDDYRLCHATGSATTIEGVKNWVLNDPSDSGQVSGHVGPGHQNGLDIIPPIPGLLPNGQNWTTYGQQVWANGCNIPTFTTVNATFTDQRCTTQQTYVGPSFSAPTYPGITRTISGAGANNTADPGETITVTYTGNAANIISNADANNSKSFTHAFPAEPNELKDCVPQPPAETRQVPRSQPSCQPAGVTTWTDVYTTPYVWNEAQGRWVKGTETGPVKTNESFTPYTDQQYFDNCAPTQPNPEKREVPRSQPSCQPAGVTTWTDVYTTPYVWNMQQRRWELGTETGPVKKDELFTPYTDQQYFDECAPTQPDPEEREVQQHEPSCYPAGVTYWTDVYTTPYVWDLQTRTWKLGTETGPVRADESFVPYTDEEYFENCAPGQPDPERRVVPQSDPSCDPAGVTYWNDVYTTPYVWDAEDRRWVLGDETGPEREMVTFTPYTDEEYFAECAPPQPPADKREVERSVPSCELGGVTSWTDVYTTAYVWDAEERAWVAGQETGPVETGKVFTAYDDEEYQRLCGGDQPPAEKREEARSVPSCELGGVTTWTDVYTTPYVWDAEERAWVPGEETGPVKVDEVFTAYTDSEYQRLCTDGPPPSEERLVPGSAPSCELGGVTSWVDVYTTPYVWDSELRDYVKGEETGPVRTNQVFTPYTDAEYQRLCGGPQPPSEERRVPDSSASCELGGVSSWVDVFTTAYVWDNETRQWVRGNETGPVRTSESFTPYTDEEYFDLCAPVKPADVTREVAGVQADCDLGGQEVWTDVYTTEYVWNAETRTWELGEETGPVRVDEQFVELTDEELEALGCDLEVKGEEAQVIKHELPEVEVKGEQGQVPTQVDAGLGSLPSDPNGSERNPLWLLAIGGGLGLIGTAGARRRVLAKR